MIRSLKNSPYYKEAFNELVYPFGSYYLFDGFVVAEINEDVIYSWEHHGKQITQEISNLYENNGDGIIYITNRIYNYSVKPSDWLKFYKNNFNLKGYAIVSYSEKGKKNSLLERLFMNSKMKRFTCINSAIEWAASEITHQKLA
ncbi:hypothetical protein KO500_04720 [Cellulophaga baltica]|uniref:hypothetical protein n=1 Tax=Cellulophaga TaxID=104264 RepID=UPI001C067E84|nr:MULTISPECIES: hypothetical protein [Cellulophaga]MBU2995721.1 hypothetical protein [Cellulophaga baltica]MDO6767115.1 hypothetical protein [Cellulophaga sp. 1_MG-2023]